MKHFAAHWMTYPTRPRQFHPPQRDALCRYDARTGSLANGLIFSRGTTGQQPTFVSRPCTPPDTPAARAPAGCSRLTSLRFLCFSGHSSRTSATSRRNIAARLLFPRLLTISCEPRSAVTTPLTLIGQYRKEGQRRGNGWGGYSCFPCLSC